MDDTTTNFIDNDPASKPPTRAQGMRVLEEAMVPRKNRGRGARKEPKVYDGSGPSGYAGTSGSPRRIRQVQCVQLPLRDVPRDLLQPAGGRKSRRIRRTQWVNIESLRAHA